MKGNYLRLNLSRENAFLQFLFGFLQGLFCWGFILSIVFISFKDPLTAIAIVMAFSLYWIIKVVYLIIFVKQTHKRLIVDEKYADWRARAEGLNDVSEYLRALHYANPPEKNSPEDHSLSLHKAEIRYLRKIKNMPANYAQIHHCVVFVLDELEHRSFDSMFESLRLGDFPAKRIMLFFVIEEGLREQLKSYVDGLDQEHKKVFYAIKIVSGSCGSGKDRLNKAHLVNQAVGLASVFFQKNGISGDSVIVSYFDRPYTLDTAYFSALTYSYMVHPYRNRVCFQPTLVFEQNLAQGDPFSRGYELGSSFLEVANATLPMHLRRFYGNSMSLELLLHLGFLPEDIVSYSQVFSIMAFGSSSEIYEVVPFPIRFAANVPVGSREIKTVATLKRRNFESACSVEGFSYFMRLFLRSKDVSILNKAKFFIQSMEASIVSSLWPLFLGVVGWLPFVLIGRDFSHPMFYFCQGQAKMLFIILSIVGFAITMHAATTLVFKPTNKEGPSAYLQSLPIVFLGVGFGFFSRAIANLKAQTSYMFGRYFKI